MRGAATVLGLGLGASLAMNVAQALWQPAADKVSDLAVRSGLPVWRDTMAARHEDALAEQRRLFEAELAAAKAGTVTLDGREMPPREAVMAVAEQITKISRQAALREAATAGAEAMPVLGIAVLAEAKSARLADACATDALLGDLVAGFEGNAGIAATDICAMAAPDADAIMKASADADQAWARARGFYPALPELMPASALQNLAPMQAALWDWAFANLRGSKPAEPETPEGEAP